jgi:hypothetical protein
LFPLFPAKEKKPKKLFWTQKKILSSFHTWMEKIVFNFFFIFVLMSFIHLAQSELLKSDNRALCVCTCGRLNDRIVVPTIS